MSVLNPMLLWFLPLVAAPFVLHLLSKQRLPVIDLPTFRFLVDSYERQHRRSQLLEWLLLLLRTLFVLFCIFLVARPIANQWAGLFGSADARPVVLLVDTSASLQFQDLGATVLDRAKQAARAVVSQLGNNDKVTLLRVGGGGSGVEILARDFSAHSPALYQRIDNLTPSLGEANILGALRQTHTLLADRFEEGSRVYVVTDLQQSNWEPVKAEAKSLLGDKGSLVIVRVGPEVTPANVAVVGEPPDGSYPVVGLPMQLHPRVRNFGTTEAEVTLEVVVDGVQIDRSSHRLAPGEAIQRSVNYTPLKEGILKGSFRCSGGISGGDTFPLDDEFQFALNVGGALRVLLVNGVPHGDRTKSELFYLKTALETRGRGLTQGDARLAKGLEAPSMQIREEVDGNWNASHLHWADVVILANCGKYHDQRVPWLRDYVEAGGGLIILPGSRSGGDSNRKLLSSPGRNLPPLLSVVMGGSDGGTSNQPQLHQRMAAMDLGHPVFSAFAPPPDSSESSRPGTSEFWQSPRIYRWFPVALEEDPTRRTKTQILARFANTLPAVIEGEFGRGKVILCAFPANTEWSNLPLKSEFVPFLLQMVSTVRRQPLLEVPAAVAIGAPVWISMPATLRDVEVEVFPPSVTPPSDSSVASQGTKIDMVLQEDVRTGRFDGSTEPGFYLVRGVGKEGTAATPGDTLRAEAGFAVNIAPAESDLRPMDFEILATSFGSDRISLADLSQTETTVDEAVGERWEIWRLLTYVLFAVFFAEFLIATMRGPSKDRPQTTSNWKQTVRSWLGGDQSPTS